MISSPRSTRHTTATSDHLQHRDIQIGHHLSYLSKINTTERTQSGRRLSNEKLSYDDQPSPKLVNSSPNMTAMNHMNTSNSNQSLKSTINNSHLPVRKSRDMYYLKSQPSVPKISDLKFAICFVRQTHTHTHTSYLFMFYVLFAVF